ncbi:MAG TPA: peptide-methionine (S)-S-oxide reductase MsrA [Terriglobia bacterium]|nr:peptide-methionine (S)-S-oxide reductase MsrA [Terriglobia bacterium]
MNITRKRFRSAVELVGFLALASVLAGYAAHGPSPTGARAPVPDFAAASQFPAPQGEQTAVLAGGCFWGVDGVFKHVKGVTSVVSGFSGGSAATAHYEIVSSGTTGHAESVKIAYDPSKISYAQLLKIFFSVALDPTELNRQGPDTGTQYRSVIFYANNQQKQIAEAYIDQLDKARVFSRPIVTQVAPLKAFYPAEAYHQNYLEWHPDNPYIAYNDLPKLNALKTEFPDLYSSKPARVGK